MSNVVRLPLLAGAAAALAACASDPLDGPRASVDAKRAPILTPGGPTGRATSPGPAVRGSPGAERPSSSPAVAEAAALAPETSSRPGGPLRAPRDDPKLRRIEVARGEKLSAISRRYEVNLRALIEANRLQPPYALAPGAALYLPPPNVHVVEPGETLYSIARRFNIDTRSLAVMNALGRPWRVFPGDEVVLPPLARDNGAIPVRAVVPVAPSAPAPAAKAPPPHRRAASEPPKYAANKATFVWPASGRVLKAFGADDDGERSEGLDLAVGAGLNVVAAAAGQVVYAGDELSGFGNLILIQHADGWVTAYANTERLLVKEGDVVAQGQPVARTGEAKAAGAKVHFELRKGREPVDPVQYLPRLEG